MPRYKFPKGANPAKDAPRCQHLIIIDTTNIINISNSSNSFNVNNNISNTASNVNNSACVSVMYKQCQCVALTNSIYCRHHIRLYPEEYERWLSLQAKKRTRTRTPTLITDNNIVKRNEKYSFADDDLRERYERQLSSGAKLLNLADDIALMITLLEKLVNSGQYKTGEVLRLIDMQRKCISTMNDLRKTQARIMTEERLNTMLERIIGVINKHITEEDTKKRIGAEFLEVAKEFRNKEQ